MITLRCTTPLLTRWGKPETDVAPTGILGDWYAKIIATRPRQLALCVNERTLLSVVIPVAPISGLLERFRIAAQTRINQIPVAASLRFTESAALTDVRIGRTVSRSVRSSLNELAYLAQAWLDDPASRDLEALGLRLCDTPCLTLRTAWPWYDAELLLAGTVSNSTVKVRPPR